MLLCTVQALGELAVLYPVNGAFYVYGVRFIDPAWVRPHVPAPAQLIRLSSD
jgi:amino acid permease